MLNIDSMKYTITKHVSCLILSLSIILPISCSKGFFDYSEYPRAIENGQSHGSAGVVTAGEWNDLNHWNYWGMLVTGNTYGNMPDYWGFYTKYRVAVKIIDNSDKPVAGAKVELYTNKSEKPAWFAITDNHGLTNCWLGLFDKDIDIKQENLAIKINGIWQKDAPLVTKLPFNVPIAELEAKTEEKIYNVYKINAIAPAKKKADIAFIVDATGSMADEIAFLKKDLMDIINKAAQKTSVPLRTATLFYRDEGDNYVTKFSDFTDKPEKTRKFISEQSANGGGDYPEAVHIALEKALQELSWDENARSKIAFMLLDAPAHHNTNVINSLHSSIANYAKNGILLIPIAASGADKNTEFMLRFFAISTGGTYVFITDDSGVGGQHTEPSVGKFQVEKLNELIVRLIKFYTE